MHFLSHVSPKQTISSTNRTSLIADTDFNQSVHDLIGRMIFVSSLRLMFHHALIRDSATAALDINSEPSAMWTADNGGIEESPSRHSTRRAWQERKLLAEMARSNDIVPSIPPVTNESRLLCLGDSLPLVQHHFLWHFYCNLMSDTGNHKRRLHHLSLLFKLLIPWSDKSDGTEDERRKKRSRLKAISRH